MTITPSELDIMCKTSDLAELAGIDACNDPSRHSEFCARAEEILREQRRLGREDDSHGEF